MSKPKQYTQGWVEFYKLKFKITEDVLIPRPETELLVDEVIKFVNSLPQTAQNSPTLLDLGTGSGNIAISLAKNLCCNVNIIASDISQKALTIAKQNAKLHGVDKKIQFIKSNLLSSFNCNLLPASCCLIIVTNLPYIPSARIPYLDSSVKDFEPLVALDGGKDGFDLYRQLFTQINKKGLKPDLILGEIDYTHGELAASEAQKFFPSNLVEIKTDLAHKQRILLIRKIRDSNS